MQSEAGMGSLDVYVAGTVLDGTSLPVTYTTQTCGVYWAILGFQYKVKAVNAREVKHSRST